MILVDTSVWVDHLRSGDDGLRDRLGTAEVLMHPMVLGEVALGNLSGRDEVLRLRDRRLYLAARSMDLSA